MKSKYYITAAIPYVNAAPHIGHALELVEADTIARYQKLNGYEVLLLSGGDENALKNVQASEKAGENVQDFVDKNTQKFLDLTKALNCEFDVWQKGSDKTTHYASSQKLWELCDKNGDIYKKSYEGIYCLGCEAFYTPEELDENGECYEHPGKKPEKISEENYFFKLSKYQKQLIELIESDNLKITPTERKNEVLSFLKEPLKDISISRSNERAKNWGVPVPNDDLQRMYVWFDALNIYQSGVGFGWDNEKYNKWWPADLHVIGKGITRFHAVYWPAFLLSAGLPTPKALFVHGYFTVNGQKMSKTLGNVIDPTVLIDKYGADALRYYLLAKFSPFTDGDFSEDKLKEVYNGELANGLGNLVARIAKLSENANISGVTLSKDIDVKIPTEVESFRFDVALNEIWHHIQNVDQDLSKQEPWKITDKGKLKETMLPFVKEILTISYKLKPFMPQTAEKVDGIFSGVEVKSTSPLFPRIA